MSLFFRSSRPAEARAVTSLPWSHGGTSASEGSLDASLSLVPVYAAVRLLADSVATLPLQAYRKTGDGRVPIKMPSVFEKPTNYGARVDWLTRAMTSLLLRGNAYGLQVGLDLDAGGRMPHMIEWLHPDRVQIRDGVYYYNGSPVTSPLLHIPALVLPGSREGVSPLSAARAVVDGGVEAQNFHRDWHKGRAVPSVIAKNNARTLEAEVATQAKDRLRATMRAGEPFVTGSDWDITLMKLSADDAGFVTSAKLTATQVASIYGVPPEMIGGEAGGSLTYSTIEQNQINFVTHTLRPWLVRLESALSSLMPAPQYVRFNVDALIRADTKTRYEVHQIARTIGLNNIDELRAVEDLAPLPDGAGQDYSPLKSAAPTPKENPDG